MFRSLALVPAKAVLQARRLIDMGITHAQKLSIVVGQRKALDM